VRDRSTLRVCVIGPSPRFLSGITYYTYGLCNALAGRVEVSAILLRQLLPTRLYPGRDRVGTPLSQLSLQPGITSVDGVDWYWGLSLGRAIWHIARTRPTTMVFQWWTGAVLHTYLALAFIARLFGATVIIEFHEAQDTGEAQLSWASRYVRLVAPTLFRMASGYIVHSQFDLRLVSETYRLPPRAIEVIPHSTYDQYSDGERWREAPDECCNLLYFGVIRAYKGVEDLIRAFDAIPQHEIHRYWLTVVGETWEDWTLPSELIERSPYRDRITFINRYVTDTEVDGIFRGADVVVLPYHRSSQSGPLHVAFHYGLPVVVTSVGGLVEAVAAYEGAFLTDPENPLMLRDAMLDAARVQGHRFVSQSSWSSAVHSYEAWLRRMTAQRSAPHEGTPEACRVAGHT
jgi:glycosyltransferase involved in cell wall biosynthesis